jgi:hypothetical protein
MENKITKTYAFISAAAAIFFLNICNIQAQSGNNCSYSWTDQSSGTLNLFYSVKSVSGQVCWAAGSNGTVRRTTDGGNTWLNGNPNTGVINGDIFFIEALDENNAWVTTSPPSTNTFIFRTTNGGTNWVQVYTNSGGNINGIKMVSASNGFAFGNPVSGTWNILVTSNGGANWPALPTAPASVIGEQGFRNSIYVNMPDMWFGASFGSVYRSTNSGLNWAFHLTTGINNYIFAVHFNSDTLGLASGISMVKSTNSGVSYFPASVPGLGNINGIDGRNNEFWYVRGTQVYRSTDGGDNWISVYSNSNTLVDVDFPDNMSGCLTGWAVGYGGTIAKMTGTLTGSEENQINIPDNYSLKQNYPNPFNPVTKINYDIPENTFVTLKIFDMLGREAAVLVKETKQAGSYTVEFSASGLTSGVYFYRLETAGYSDIKKMILLK